MLSLLLLDTFKIRLYVEKRIYNKRQNIYDLLFLSFGLRFIFVNFVSRLKFKSKQFFLFGPPFSAGTGTLMSTLM